MQYLNNTKIKKKLYRLSSCEGGLDIILRLQNYATKIELNRIQFTMQFGRFIESICKRDEFYLYVCNVPPPDNAWESLQEDGSWNLRAWNGMVYNYITQTVLKLSNFFENNYQTLIMAVDNQA